MSLSSNLGISTCSEQSTEAEDSFSSAPVRQNNLIIRQRAAATAAAAAATHLAAVARPGQPAAMGVRQQFAMLLQQHFSAHDTSGAADQGGELFGSNAAQVFS